MNAALLRFLSSATLGMLRVGMSCSDIVSQMGSAFNRSVADEGAEVWMYGPLQLSITKGKLYALRLDCLAKSPLPAALQEIEVLPSETSLYSFIDLLDEHGIAWEIDPAFSFDRQLCIRTESGVGAYFDLDRRELQSLQV